jgi:hypothetical protein
MPGHTDDVAWESNQIARSDIYAALQIPVEPCEPPAAVCSNEPEVDLAPAYMNHAEVVAGHQLAKAGFRLASLLNGMWTRPVAPGENTVTRPVTSPEEAYLSSKPVMVRSSVIAGAKFTRGLDAEATTVWRRRIGLCFRAAQPQNKPGIGQFIIVVDALYELLSRKRVARALT